MLHRSAVRELIPGLTPFPENVFAPEQPWLLNHFLPLLSIDLGILRPELQGTVVHMLNPIEPYDGVIGGETQAFHNDYTGENWLAFSLTEGNRYRFLGQPEYFLPEPAPAAGTDERGGDDAWMCKHAQQLRESYAKARSYFQTHGRLASFLAYGKGEPEPDEHDWLDTLGGEMEYGNWASAGKPPPAFESKDGAGSEKKQGLSFRKDSSHLPNDGLQLLHGGHAFFQVATVAGYNWCATGADAILLFYEPHSRIALFTYDWT